MGDLHGRGDAGGQTAELRAVVGEEIIFRTGRGQLAAATNNTVVAFEVDDVDIATRTGLERVGDREGLLGERPRSAVRDHLSRSAAVGTRENGAHHHHSRFGWHRADTRA